MNQLVKSPSKKSGVALTILLFCAGVLIAGCGNPSNKTSTLPTPADPNPAGGSLPSTPSPVPPGTPDFTRSTALNLFDKVGLSGLTDLLAASNLIVIAPLTLEPVIKMTLNRDRSALLKGKLLIGFEDQAGLWAAELPTVDGASVRTSTTVESFHTDREFSFFVEAIVNGDNLAGTIYYRIRRAGETQCFKPRYVCQNASGQVLPDYFCTFPSAQEIEQATAATCRSYLNKYDTSNVKALGTFTAKTADWFVN